MPIAAPVNQSRVRVEGQVRVLQDHRVDEFLGLGADGDHADEAAVRDRLGFVVQHDREEAVGEVGLVDFRDAAELGVGPQRPS